VSAFEVLGVVIVEVFRPEAGRGPGDVTWMMSKLDEVGQRHSSPRQEDD
jgi:hypothetical protein